MLNSGDITGRVDLSKMRPPIADGMTSDDESIARRLWHVWAAHLSGNLEKLAYYSCAQPLRDLGVGLPPNIARHTSNRVDWPRIAVDYLANRSIFDGLAVSDEALATEVNAMLAATNFGAIYNEALRAELICSPALITVTAGAADEPPVLLRAYSAIESACLWSSRDHALAAAMAVTETAADGAPTELVLFFPDHILTLRASGHFWHIDAAAPSEALLAVALTYRPDLFSPFGHSRISRTVRDLTDEARKNKIYTALASELFSVPQRYLLGADDSIFSGTTKWDAYLGNIFAITTNADGEKPTYGQLTQMTMEPLLAVWRKIAKEFSAATGVPLHSLGVTADSNPTSFEAMHMAENDIVIEAEALNAQNARALEHVGRLAWCLYTATAPKDAPQAILDLRALFANPQRPSLAQRADYALKVASVASWYASSDKFLEDLGYSAGDRIRLAQDRARSGGTDLLRGLIDSGATS